jgi:hypothetical protein
MAAPNSDSSSNPADRINLYPIAVTDPKIRKLLQLAGLRFMCSRADWLKSEALAIGIGLKSRKLSSDEVDEKLAEMGVPDICYPELMRGAE